MFGGASSDPPYEYLDSDGRPQGFNIELVRALARETGRKVEFRLAPWREIMRRFDEGEFDLVGLGYSDARAERYDYLEEMWTLRQVVLFPRTRGTYPRGAHDLVGEVVAVTESGWLHGFLETLPAEERPQLRLLPSVVECARVLADGQATAVGGNALHLRHVAPELHDKGVVEVPLRATPYFLVTRKGHGGEMVWVREALLSLKRQGVLARLVETRLADPPHRHQWWAYGWAVASLLGLAGLMFAGIALWNRSLSRRVVVRTAEFASIVEEKDALASGMAASEARYRQLVESVHAVVWRADARDLRLSFVSREVESILGYTPEHCLSEPGFWDRSIHPEDRQRVLVQFAATRAGDSSEVDYRALASDGRVVWLRNIIQAVAENGRPPELIGVIVDITQRKSLEAQLSHSQRMEAIGRLAGGVAHDFNNLLTVITGYAALLQRDLGGKVNDGRVEEIQKAGDRAAALTRQLLAFSRRQVLAPEPLDLSAVVAGLEGMLHRLIDTSVSLVTHLQPGLGTVVADPGQIEQVIMNLVVNAADAMPRGGLLTIETTEVDSIDASASDAVAPHVLLSVRDSGVGMDPKTLSHIFEPFFTTKGVGEGTGLGLATAYGIVEQSGGEIRVDSTPGQGSTFRVYLPRVSAKVVSVAPDQSVGVPRGSETILLVEDDDPVRDLSRQVLENLGYCVLEARHAGEALIVVERHPDEIDLLVTDVMMPHMNGVELAERVRPLRPDMQVLFVSGHAAGVALPREITGDAGHFLKKPFTPNVLARAVRRLLEVRVQAGAEGAQKGGARAR